ncbi:unnamed protein product [Amaranthus hypochondriacus]
MELKSSMNETWKLFALGTLIGWLFVLHFLGNTNHNVSLFTATKSFFAVMDPSKFSFSDGNPNKNKNKKCNIFDGKWVYKPQQFPSYDPLKCPFLEEKMSCQKNGRPDLEYERWFWEATNCEIPLLNGRDMIERLRNKRVILVGDSLNRNMWESLACILYTSIPASAALVRDNSSVPVITFTAKDYNMSVEFYWSPFLTQFDLNYKESGKKVLVLDRLSPNSVLWSGADIMVFNSGHWWAQTGKYRRWDFLEYEGKLIDDMALEKAYELGMRTWQTWMEQNVDPIKTTVFFRSISMEHKTHLHDQWCYNKTLPIMDESYKSSYPKPLVNVIENVIKGIKKHKVKYLNITKLSQYRIDAHPSIYRFKDWKNLTRINQDTLSTRADCSHWCLPGVPDTWNRLLYASLFFNSSVVGDLTIL